MDDLRDGFSVCRRLTSMGAMQMVQSPELMQLPCLGLLTFVPSLLVWVCVFLCYVLVYCTVLYCHCPLPGLMWKDIFRAGSKSDSILWIRTISKTFWKVIFRISLPDIFCIFSLSLYLSNGLTNKLNSNWCDVWVLMWVVCNTDLPRLSSSSRLQWYSALLWYKSKFLAACWHRWSIYLFFSFFFKKKSALCMFNCTNLLITKTKYNN